MILRVHLLLVVMLVGHLVMLVGHLLVVLVLLKDR
jgi:hypothetical protein